MAEKKRRRKHVGLIVLAVFLAAAAAVAVWQKNNIIALKEFVSAGSQEEIEQKLEQNQQAITDAVEKNPEIVVRDLTEEEKQALRDGTLTQEEIADRLTGGTQAEQPKEETPKQETPKAETPKQETPKEETPKQEEKPAEQPTESDYQKQISAVVAKVYVLREKFVIELDNMKNEAVAEYKAIPEAERTSGKLTDFAKKYVKRAAELEKQCDTEMDAIVGELDALISANNGDYSIIDTVIETYANEKSLKKAWYMAELKKRGFVV